MSGVYALAVSSIAPSALFTGLSIEATKRYRPQTWVGWIIVIVGFSLTSTVLATDSLAKSIGCFALIGLGGGCVVFVTRGLFILKLSWQRDECDSRVPHSSPSPRHTKCPCACLHVVHQFVRRGEYPDSFLLHTYAFTHELVLPYLS
jgi:hypothetical protein